MTNNNLLKSCPFCGGEAKIVFPASDNDPYVCCGKCFISTNPNKKAYLCVDVWNARTVQIENVCADLQRDMKPKPLIWSEPLISNNYTISAKTPFGTYYIHVDGGQHSAWLDNMETNDGDMIGEVCGDLFTAQGYADDDLCQKIKEMF